jgi:hypothetical protein
MVGRKRKPTERIHFYKPPWRADVIVRHLEVAHLDLWNIYKNLSSDCKKNYFEEAIRRASTLHNFMNLGRDELTFRVSREIVEVIIGELMFCPEDELGDDEDGHIAEHKAKFAQLKRNTLHDVSRVRFLHLSMGTGRVPHEPA